MSDTLKTQNWENCYSDSFRKTIMNLSVSELEVYYSIAITFFGDGVETEVIKQMLQFKKTGLGKVLF